MRNLLAIIPAIMLVLLTTAFSKAPSLPLSPVIKVTLDQKNGIFTVTAFGQARPETMDSLRRKYESHAAAILVAQNEAQKRLQGKKVLAQKEIRSKYDRRQNCTLTYEVTFQN